MVSIGWPLAIRKSGLHVTAGVVTLRLANFTLRVAPICLTRCPRKRFRS
jgi:hypothetical protein